jgi:putative DNA primase/helicase
MTARGIASAIGGHWSGSWWRCVCPVHGSRTGHSASLALRDGDRSLIVHCHAGCDPRDVMAALRRLGLDAGTQYRPPPDANGDNGATRRIAVARRIWERAEDAQRSPVAAYLAGRGLTLPAPPSLRWAPSLRRLDGNDAPAMVARIDGPDGEMIGVHRTWLARGADGFWRRRDRAMLGRAAGGAVWLAPAAETMLLGEGLETCFSGMQATGMPGWAALSTSGLTQLVLPGIVRDVVICADHDRSGAGERAAHAAAQRWLAEGRRVRLAMPPEPGTDMADVLGGTGSTMETANVAA